VTETDRRALLNAAAFGGEREVAPERVVVIPIAVDTTEMAVIRRRPNPGHILTLGTLHYAPNADGIRWFVREVLPRVRESVAGAVLTIVGKNPPRDFFRVAAQAPDAVRVTGYVPELTPLLETTAVIAIPVLAGSGMRVRILEALSRGLPVVTTTVGMEGIDAAPGSDLLVGDSPEEFAAAVVRLLRDTGLQDRLSQNGRRLIEQKYDWRVALRRLDAVYAMPVRER
jgi:glycosyltransferase involved in cell wall biosynthesis